MRRLHLNCERESDPRIYLAVVLCASSWLSLKEGNAGSLTGILSERGRMMLLLLIIHNHSEVLYMHYHFILKATLGGRSEDPLFWKRKPKRLGCLPGVTLPGRARSRWNPRACAVISEPECQTVEILNEEMLKAVLIMSDFDMVYQAPF